MVIAMESRPHSGSAGSTHVTSTRRGCTRRSYPAAHVGHRQQAASGVRTRNTGTDLERLGRAAYVALLLCAVVAIAASLLIQPEKPRPEGWSAITVGEADSLWSLAEVNPVPGLSTAETVDLIAATNHLPSTVVMAGQTVCVPQGGSDTLLVASRE